MAARPQQLFGDLQRQPARVVAVQLGERHLSVQR